MSGSGETQAGAVDDGANHVVVRVAAIVAYSDHDNIGELFLAVRDRVCEVLYIAVDDMEGQSSTPAAETSASASRGNGSAAPVDEQQLLSKRLRLTHDVYRLCASACPALNVRILFRHAVADLSNGCAHSNGDSSVTYALSRCPEVVFTSEQTEARCASQPASSVLHWLESRCVSLYGKPVVERAARLSPKDMPLLNKEVPDTNSIFSSSSALLCSHDNVVMGGTFDRLHCGHCLLLTSAIVVTRRKLAIGVVDGNMLTSRTLREMIEPVGHRIDEVVDFLSDVAPCLRVDPEAIHNAAGPAVSQPDLSCIVVSQGTIKGADSINQQRQSDGLSSLCVLSVSLTAANCNADKMSSTQARRADLGKLLPAYVPGRTNAPWMTRIQKSVQQNQHGTPVEDIAGFMGDKSINIQLPPPEQLQKTTYVVGLTGGIATGKTTLSSKLREMGAAILSCDRLAHQAYMPGTECYSKVLATFGEDIVNDDGTVNRARLAEIVFKNPEQLNTLNRIVWPSVARMINDTMVHHASEGTRLVIVESSLLKESGMVHLVDEVWTVMVPSDEALRRLQASGLSQSQAKSRVTSQAANTERMDYTTVAFSSLWSREETLKQQLLPAFSGLQNRMKCFKLATLGRTFDERFLKVCRACGVQLALAKAFLASHLQAFHYEKDERWAGEDSVIRKLNQCDYLLPYLDHPQYVQLAIFFSRGNIVQPLAEHSKVKQTLQLLQQFVEDVKLSERVMKALHRLLAAGYSPRLVQAHSDFEYFSDLEVTEDSRLLVVETELGTRKLSHERRQVFQLVEASPRILRTTEMDKLLGLRIKAKLKIKRP